jgi:hypothetical protein
MFQDDFGDNILSTEGLSYLINNQTSGWQIFRGCARHGPRNRIVYRLNSDYEGSGEVSQVLEMSVPEFREHGVVEGNALVAQIPQELATERCIMFWGDGRFCTGRDSTWVRVRRGNWGERTFAKKKFPIGVIAWGATVLGYKSR